MHKHHDSLQTANMQIDAVYRYATHINTLSTSYIMAVLMCQTYINVVFPKYLTFRQENKQVLLWNFVSFSWKALPILCKEQARSWACHAADQHLKAVWQSVSHFVVTVGVENIVAVKRLDGGWNLFKRCSGKLFGCSAIFIWTQKDFYIEISSGLMKLSLSNWSVHSLKI